jgi:hypothetical protein
MAIAAFRKLYPDALRMRRPVAVLTGRYHSVTALVAARACQGLVFRRGGAEEVGGFLVTRVAVF